MINSQKGKEMFNYISPIYHQSKIMQSLFETIGIEIDSAYKLSEDMLLQMFPQTATWGLDFWEQATGLISNSNDSLEIRRAMVLNKLQNPTTLTPLVLSRLLSNFTGRECDVEENTSDYEFTVTIVNSNGVVNFTRLIELINKSKPAHLSFRLVNKYLNEIIIENRKVSYFTQQYYLCGTIDVNYNEYITTQGINIYSDIESARNSYISDIITRTSEDTYSVATGSSKTTELECFMTDYISNEIARSSENTYSFADGLSKLNEIENFINKYSSDEISRSSEDTLVRR